MNAVVLAEVDTDAAPDAREVTHKVNSGVATATDTAQHRTHSVLHAGGLRVCREATFPEMPLHPTSKLGSSRRIGLAGEYRARNECQSHSPELCCAIIT